MATTIYVLSDKNFKINNFYKVGTHTGTISMLKSRYSTYLSDLEIHYFIPASNARDIENKFKTFYNYNRVINASQ